MPIYSIPSLRQPESISPQFYFTSQSFISKAQSDIDQLLNHWIQSAKSNHLHLGHNQINSNNQRNKSGPFLKFKSIYSRLGWVYIHLSVVDPALRKHWFNTIIRLFLSNLTKENAEPLKQIGVLFGLWCFWGTQPACSVLGPKHYIVIDPERLDYINQIPSKFASDLDQYFNGSIDELFEEALIIDTKAPHLQSQNTNPSLITSASLSIKHRAHLDPNIFGPPPPTIKPSDSLHQVLKNLVDQDAFLIQPTEVALIYPPLPTNSISFSNTSAHDDPSSNDNNLPLLADITVDLDHNPNSTSFPHNSNVLSEIPELILSTKSDLSKLQKIENKLLCDPEELNKTRLSYLSTKTFLTDPDEWRRDSMAQEDSREHDSEHYDPSLARELFIEAIGMTRKVIQKTGPGLDHLLFPNLPPSTPPTATPTDTTTSATTNARDLNQPADVHQHSLDAFLLVDRAQSVTQLSKLINPPP